MKVSRGASTSVQKNGDVRDLAAHCWEVFLSRGRVLESKIVDGLMGENRAGRSGFI